MPNSPTRTQASLGPVAQAFKEEKVDSSEDNFVDKIKSESGAKESSDTTQLPPHLKKSQSIPQRLEALSELSLENLSSLDPKDVQIWMLLQMQRMVKDTMEVTKTLAHRSRGDMFEQPPTSHQPSASPPPPPPPPYPPPPGDTEPIYDEDVGEDYYNQSNVEAPSRSFSCSVTPSYHKVRSTTSRKAYQEPRQRSNTTLNARGTIVSLLQPIVPRQRSRQSAHHPPIKPKPDILGKRTWLTILKKS